MDDLFQDTSGSSRIDYAALAQKIFYRTRIAVRNYWWLFPIMLALGVVAAAIYSHLSEPQYSSSSKMIVSGRIDALPDEEVYLEERSNFFGTQIELILSDPVKYGAVERVSLTQPELYEAMRGTQSYADDGLKSLLLAAEVKDDTSIFEIVATGPHPDFVRSFLDALMEEYVNRRAEMRSKTSAKTFEAIAAQIEEIEAEVFAGEDAIVEFQESNNIVFIQEQGSTAGEYLNRLKREAAELATEGRMLDSVLKDPSEDNVMLDQLHAEVWAAPELSRDSLGAQVSTIFGSDEENESYATSKELLHALRGQLEEFSIYLKPKHPKIISLKNQIERTENQLSIQRRQTLERIGERRRMIESKILSLNEEITIWEGTALENGRLIAEFERLQSRLERSKAALVRNQEALRAIDSNQNLQQERVSVLEPAGLPYQSTSGIYGQLLKGGLAGCLFAAACVFLLAMLDNRVITADDLGEHFDEPLLGAIPLEAHTEGDRPQLLQRDDQRYVFAEACRNLRTSVLFLGDDGFAPSVFAITSAVPSEGKSTVSSNLSIALSFAHSKVLLIDADLRRGHLHRLFNASRERGLADVLEGRLPWSEAVQQTNYESLDFISVGDYPSHPAELLMRPEIDLLIEEAREKYDFVIFDTAPILATDDTTSFGAKMDLVLFTIRSAYTQVRQIKPAMARLRERNVRIGGMIMNFMDLKQPGYYYYRYSEYYSDSTLKKDSRPDLSTPA